MVRRSRYAAALDRDPASGARRGVEEGGSKIETITPPSLPPPIPKVEQHPLPFFKRSRNLKRCVREENLFILSLRERLSRDEMILLFIFFFLSFFLLFFFFFGTFLDEQSKPRIFALVENSSSYRYPFLSRK